MTSSCLPRFPRLRPLDLKPIAHNGESFIYLRDPLQLSEKILLIPEPLLVALACCDGTWADAAAISRAIALRYGLLIQPNLIEQLIGALDEAFLLDNDRSSAAQAEALAEYRQGPYRTPALAGSSYPADPNELRRLFDDLCQAARRESNVRPLSTGRGLVSPHIDYARGGAAYARVWQRAATMAREADLVVLLGTDHYGSATQLTLTRQHYATPFGALPTSLEAVEALTEVLGTAAAFAGELHHRAEHSIELAAVWLHYIRDGKPVELLPILCGSFAPYVQGEADLTTDRTLENFIATLKEITAHRRVLVVAAGDLAHVGPAFSTAPVDQPGRQKLKESDDALIERMRTGDAAGFFAAIKQVNDCHNVCGVSPIYLALRLLPDTQGELIAYDQCPADEADTSFVSICGVVFT